MMPAHLIRIWKLEDGIVIVAAGPFAAVVGPELGGLQREGVLDAEPAGQDVALVRNSTLVGSAIVGAGHGKFSVVAFREIAVNWHCLSSAFRVAGASPGNGGCPAYLFDLEGNTILDWA
jgi:hypothetical protein